MKLARTVGAVMLVLAGTPFADALGQANPFWSSRFGPRLTDPDYRHLADATNRLNAAPHPRAGQTLSWSNPQTGAHGTVELARIYRRQDTTCHAMRYRNTPPHGRTQTYNLDWCASPEGWKVAS